MNRPAYAIIAAYALVVLSTLVCGSLHAQTCKPYKDEIDPFTKTRKVVFKTKPIVGAWFVSASDRLHLELSQHYTSIRSMSDGATVTFLFTDDSTLELKNVGTEVASYIGTSNWMLSPFLPLTVDQLKMLSTKTVKMVRLQLTDYNSDRAYTAKHAEELRRAAHCLVTTMGL